jgi:hypothetical protein
LSSTNGKLHSPVSESHSAPRSSTDMAILCMRSSLATSLARFRLRPARRR